jgi:hypothetical protein
MKTVEFAHDIGDQVCITDYPDIKGRVIGIALRVVGITYYVCWWQDGNRKDEWLHEWEIRAVPAESKRKDA